MTTRQCPGRGQPTESACLELLARHRSNHLVFITEPWQCTTCRLWHYTWTIGVPKKRRTRAA